MKNALAYSLLDLADSRCKSLLRFFAIFTVYSIFKMVREGLYA